MWQPFLDAIDAAPKDLRSTFSPLKIVVDLGAHVLVADPRQAHARLHQAATTAPARPRRNVFWPGDQGQAGQLLHGYDSAWLPASLLGAGRRAALADALFAATGTAASVAPSQQGPGRRAPRRSPRRGTPPPIPAVLDAFALADPGRGRRRRRIPAWPATSPTSTLARQRRPGDRPGAPPSCGRSRPEPAAYVSESNYFEPRLAARVLGRCELARLRRSRRRYDPEGLFFIHHGPGSERWSADGFTRTA